MPAFQLHSSIQGDLVPPSEQIAQCTATCLRREGDKEYFEWRDFSEALDDYIGSSLMSQRFTSFNLNYHETDIAALCDKIPKYLHQELSDSVDASLVSETIKKTLTSLKDEKDNGYLQFASEGGKSSWEYRVVFGARSAHNPSSLHFWVTTISFSVVSSEESDWYDMSTDTRKILSVYASAVELVVDKDFKLSRR